MNQNSDPSILSKEDFIQLTLNVYRLTSLFPKKEPLRYKIREIADEILADLIANLEQDISPYNRRVQEIKKDLELINGYFEVAKYQNWVSPLDVLEIQKEYSNIVNKELETEIDRNQIALIPRENEVGFREKSHPVISISERHKKILEILKEKEKIQVGELAKVFPALTKRTLRRDFEYLVNQGLIERLGEKNSTFYQLKR